MNPLSVYYVTKNEEKRLPLSLEQAKRVADEIVIVDSGSTDRTEEIAARYGARFIHHEWVSIGHQVSFAESCCLHKWVLRLDADEVLSEGLIREIMEIKEDPRFDGYKLRIGEVFPGIPEPCRWAKHFKLIRLYNVEKMKMSGRFGHDDVISTGPDIRVKVLHHFIHHHSLLSLSHLFEKRNFETDMQLKRALAEGKRYSPGRMVGALSLNFFKHFFLDRFFLYGFWGFISSVSVGYLRFLKFAKYYEHEQLGKYGEK